MKKLWILFLLFTFFLTAIVIKLALIQVIASDHFSSNNYLQTQKIVPSRGDIYDRNNNLLALNQINYLMYIEPKKIQDKENTIKKIDKVLKIGESTLEGRFKMDKVWAKIADGISKEKTNKLQKLRLKGIGFEQEERRFYPEGSSAAHLLGFVGKDKDGNNTGYFGIEGFYEKDLAGIPGLLKTERDVFGNPIVIGIQEKLTGADGRDLVLTIDKRVQQIIKEHLVKGVERFKAKEGCITVLDPFTMEILAMSCIPDFDPHEYYKSQDEVFTNPAISKLYEPGSIFKPLIVAAALNEKKIKLSDTYSEVGPVKVSGGEIQTWDKKYEGKINIVRILEKSSNVGMVYVGEKLGKGNLLSYIRKYGLDGLTNIDIQGEVSGFIKPDNEWYPLEVATTTFGQGIVVTQIQMIRAFSALINGGYIMRPYTVSEIKSASKNRGTNNPIKVRKILSDKTSLLMRETLEKTVMNAEAKWARPKGYRIGGKTGTAQIPIKGRYDASKTIASFIGFVPVDKPKFLILISLKEPSTSPWGSETAAPLFFDVVKDLIVYYNILPE